MMYDIVRLLQCINAAVSHTEYYVEISPEPATEESEG